MASLMEILFSANMLKQLKLHIKVCVKVMVYADYLICLPLFVTNNTSN